MAIIVFRGVEVQVDPSEFCSELRKLFIDDSNSSIVWPKPLGPLKKRAKVKGAMTDIVRETFTEVGVTQLLKANNDSTIRQAFYSAGWTAKVVGTKKAGTFKVIRKS